MMIVSFNTFKKLYSTRTIRLFGLIYLSLAVVATAIVHGDDDPTRSEATVVDIEGFERELELAGRANDRNSRVSHLRKSLTYRPDHADNIDIEFQIAIELTQRFDPEYDQEKPDPIEGLPILKKISKQYEHMDYYRSGPPDSPHSPQLIVPRAAILEACIQRSHFKDDATARKRLYFAMECLEQTHQKRIDDWRSEPKPAVDPKEENRIVVLNKDGLWEEIKSEVGKSQARLNAWQLRQERALRGEVFGKSEMAIVKAAVRQYGYSYGPHNGAEVSSPMGEIIRSFPNTPMSQIAQGHIERANEMMLNKMDKGIDELFLKKMDEIPLDEEMLLGSGTGTDTPGSQKEADLVSVESPRQVSQNVTPEEDKPFLMYGMISGAALVVIAVLLFCALRRTKKQ